MSYESPSARAAKAKLRKMYGSASPTEVDGDGQYRTPDQIGGVEHPPKCMSLNVIGDDLNCECELPEDHAGEHFAVFGDDETIRWSTSPRYRARAKKQTEEMSERYDEALVTKGAIYSFADSLRSTRMQKEQLAELILGDPANSMSTARERIAKAIFLDPVSDRWGDTAPEIIDVCTSVASIVMGQLVEALNTVENVKHWRLWAHETYGHALKGTVTANALNKILGIEPEPRTPEQIAYTAKVRAAFEEYARETVAPAPLPLKPWNTCPTYSAWPGEEELTQCGLRKGHRGNHETVPAGRGWARGEQA